MNMWLAGICKAAAMALLVMSVTGCAAFRAKTTTVDVDRAGAMTERFDFTDLRSITESFANELAYGRFISEMEAPP
jgi:hypothetical protein